MVMRYRDLQSVANPSGWLDSLIAQYEKDPDFIAEGLALAVTEDAAFLMEQEGITRAALADRMGVSRAYVSRLFNAPPNMTLRSIAALAIALDRAPSISLVGSESRGSATLTIGVTVSTTWSVTNLEERRGTADDDMVSSRPSSDGDEAVPRVVYPREADDDMVSSRPSSGVPDFSPANPWRSSATFEHLALATSEQEALAI